MNAHEVATEQFLADLEDIEIDLEMFREEREELRYREPSGARGAREIARSVDCLDRAIAKCQAHREQLFAEYERVLNEGEMTFGAGRSLSLSTDEAAAFASYMLNGDGGHGA